MARRAAGGFTVVLEGQEDLIKKLNKINKGVNRILVRAMKKAAAPIIRAAKAKAPFDTGELRDHIGVSVNAKPGNVALIVGPTRGTFYGGFNEFGTKNQPARPFMRPAFDEKKKVAAKIFGDQVIGAINAAAVGK